MFIVVYRVIFRKKSPEKYYRNEMILEVDDLADNLVPWDGFEFCCGEMECGWRLVGLVCVAYVIIWERYFVMVGRIQTCLS